MLSELLEKIAKYRVLFVGDAIIDEYHYVNVTGKASKEPIICTTFRDSEVFQGGIWAAAKHLETFCADVEIYAGNKVTTKRRFIEPTYVRKLFEVHYEAETLKPPLPDPSAFDLVVVADFGHGCITPSLMQELTKKARYLVVNAQTNSTNYGFNLITKYPRADYVVIDEPEAWLAAHDNAAPIDEIILKLGFKRIVVTQGPKGCTGYDGNKFVSIPSVARKVVDTMGAGDAFLAVTAPFACAGADIGTLCEIGNAAGAVKCGIVGHRQPVTREALCATLA